MIFQAGQARVSLIGDPHLGKKFEVGVPQHRRGERERSQMEQFAAELNVDADMIIMVGDLFDHPYVGYPVAHAAASMVVSAALSRPQTMFVMMAGNHDMPKNVDTVGAFDIFAGIAHGRVDNLVVARRPMQIDEVAVFPWEWGVAADDQVADFVETGTVSLAVGHWDLTDFGPSVDGKVHLAPVDALHELFGTIPLASGHYHKAGPYEIDGSTVHCTGSMQPYSHGEDPEGKLYVTVSLEEALSGDYRDKHVRVRLAPGEVLPEIDALAVTPLRVAGESKEVITHDLNSFDWAKIMARKLSPLAAEVREFISERLSTDEQSTEE